MRFLLTLVAILCVSCVGHETELYGIGKTRTLAIFGDGSAANTILGDTLVYKNSTATRILANMFMGLVAAYQMGNVGQQQEITKQMANAGATKVQIRTAELAAQSEALKVGAGTTSQAIQGKLFQEGATIFKQP